MISHAMAFILFTHGVLLGASLIGIIESVKGGEKVRVKAYLFCFSIFTFSISVLYFSS